MPGNGFWKNYNMEMTAACNAERQLPFITEWTRRCIRSHAWRLSIMLLFTRGTAGAGYGLLKGHKRITFRHRNRNAMEWKFSAGSLNTFGKFLRHAKGMNCLTGSIPSPSHSKKVRRSISQD
jgi:hypothetical protein